MSTTYMGLVLPVVSSTPGPLYATENNTAFTTIDSHDHSTGKGAPITGASLSIAADLSFNSFSATTLKSTQYVTGQTVTANNSLYTNAGVPTWLDNTGTSNQLLKSTTTSFTTGDIVYASSATQFTRLGIGSTGQVLKVSGALPSWQSPANSLSVTSKTANYTLTNTDDLVICDTNAVGSFTITLPLASANPGKTFYIKRFDVGAQPTRNIAIATTGGDTVDGRASSAVKLTAQYQCFEVCSDGVSNWDIVASFNPAQVPTVQKFTSSSGTYTTPTNPVPLYIKVTMVGGGGGGGGSSGAGTSGSNAGNTTFGTTLLVANGGSGGTNMGVGGSGGTASLGSGPLGLAISGAKGGPGATTAGAVNISAAGGDGGSSALGGAAPGVAGDTGINAATNSGSGGSGCGINGAGANVAGGGGGAGGYVNAIITSPTTTYAYAVGAAGAGGTQGGNGAAGIIVVEEFYQ